MTGPRLPDVGVVALVPNPWGDVWQSRNAVLTELAEYFHVVWCDPLLGWRRLWSPGGRRPADCYPGLRKRPGFHVCRQEPWLPELGRPRALSGLATGRQLSRARAILSREGVRRVAMYLWLPRFASALDWIEHDVSLYHIDDEYSFSNDERPVDPAEAALISRVDRPLIHSPALLEKKGGLNPETVFLPNGVDYEAFSAPAAEPEDLRDIPRPRIGYVGRIKWQLDLGLTLQLARRHREWSFVMVGPLAPLRRQEEHAAALRELPNVHFLGGKPVHELPAYTANMDVCTLGYEQNDYTRYIFPIKLHEYLASGRPVVATPIRSLLDFRDVVLLAEDLDEWSRALRRALSPEESGPGGVAARRAVARQYDWKNLVHRIARTICEPLGPGYLERLGPEPSLPFPVPHRLERSGAAADGGVAPGRPGP